MYITKQNNFDLIRLILALIVFVVHTSTLSGNMFFEIFAEYLNSSLAVYAFFVLSGFLIFMSFDRKKDLIGFMKNRFFRIYPAYIFVIACSAVILLFVSTYPAQEYFSVEWSRYLLLNAFTLNFLKPTLPGVFQGNDIQAVNGALWTIKIEVMFYLTVPLIGLLMKKYSKIAILVILYILSIVYYELLMYMGEYTNKNIYILLAKQLPGQLAFFISGALLYYYFEHFKKYASSYLMLSIFLFIIYKFYNIWIFFPFSLAFLVIYLATMFRYLGNFGKFGDFSFGVYIWHFPIIQIFVNYNILSTYPISGSIFLILIVLIIAVFSWKFIEKPFLRKKSHYILAEKD